MSLSSGVAGRGRAAPIWLICLCSVLSVSGGVNARGAQRQLALCGETQQQINELSVGRMRNMSASRASGPRVSRYRSPPGWRCRFARSRAGGCEGRLPRTHIPDAGSACDWCHGRHLRSRKLRTQEGREEQSPHVELCTCGREGLQQPFPHLEEQLTGWHLRGCRHVPLRRSWCLPLLREAYRSAADWRRAVARWRHFSAGACRNTTFNVTATLLSIAPQRTSVET